VALPLLEHKLTRVARIPICSGWTFRWDLRSTEAHATDASNLMERNACGIFIASLSVRPKRRAGTIFSVGDARHRKTARQKETGQIASGCAADCLPFAMIVGDGGAERDEANLSVPLGIIARGCRLGRCKQTVKDGR
jgi:hypothetical protein